MDRQTDGWKTHNWRTILAYLPAYQGNIKKWTVERIKELLWCYLKDFSLCLIYCHYTAYNLFIMLSPLTKVFINTILREIKESILNQYTFIIDIRVIFCSSKSANILSSYFHLRIQGESSLTLLFPIRVLTKPLQLSEKGRFPSRAVTENLQQCSLLKRTFSHTVSCELMFFAGGDSTLCEQCTYV